MQERRLSERRELHGDELRALSAVRFLWLTVLVALAGARTAHADGAFADSLRLFLPPERADELVVATNFGLVTSEDGGQAWSWVCEQPNAPDAAAYQMGPAPGRRLFAVTRAAVAYTDDLGCSWSLASLGPVDARALDVFPDPTDQRLVYASAAIGPASEQRTVLLASRDGGRTFDAILHQPPAQTVILGVESARSSPATIYLALRQGPGAHPGLARSDDGGQSWQVFDVEATTGSFDLGLIAVDPIDARRLFVRVRGFPDESLAISEDGGATLRVAARIPDGVLSAFGRRADGTLLLGGMNARGGVVLSSKDAIVWAPWASAPLARDFGERGGNLYVIGDDQRDQFALAVSAAPAEGGAGLRKVMRLGEVSSVRACAVTTCAAACRAEAARGTFPAAVCDAHPAAFDAGATPDAPATPTPPTGGGCSFGGRPAPMTLLVLLLLSRRRFARIDLPDTRSKRRPS
jgi:photosystem II stability/assembly factor-like uncharacterized protein